MVPMTAVAQVGKLTHLGIGAEIVSLLTLFRADRCTSGHLANDAEQAPISYSL
jgi:hypothetical protein